MYQHKKTTKKVHKILIKSLKSWKKIWLWWGIWIFFLFDFDWSKDVQENLMHDIEYIIKNFQYLTENKIKNKIEPLLLKHKNGNNIQENKKEQNEWTA